MKKIIILFSLFLTINPASIFADSYLRYYSMTNKAPSTAEEIHYYFAYPVTKGKSDKIARYSSSFDAPLASGQARSWQWQAMQQVNDGYTTSYPYKIEIVWRENGVKKSKTTCIKEAWAGDGHWAIEKDYSVSGFKGIDTDPRPSIKMGPPRGCDIGETDNEEIWSENCCEFDGKSDWGDHFQGN